jgi:mRNA interferase MazF
LTTVEPWQVWWAVFDPQVGREQMGRRPAIVAGTDFACSLPNDLVFLIPCTTRGRGLPFQIPVTLDKPSVAMCDQLKSVSRQRLRELLLDRLAEPEIAAIRRALRTLIDTR